MKDEALKLALEAHQAMREWIDAVPDDTVLPAMPGCDRDWLDTVEATLKQALAAPVQETPFQIGQRLRQEGKGISDLWGAVSSDADMPEAQRGFDSAAQPAVQEPVADAWMHEDGRLTDAKAKTARVENFHGWRPMAFIASATTPPAAPELVAAMAQILGDRLAKEQAVYLSMETAKSFVKSMLAAAPEKWSTP